MSTNILEIRRRRALRTQKAPTFHVREMEVDNPHKLQLNVNYGNAPGPWLVITMNDKAWAIGYLPPEEKESQ